jgi:transposase
MLLHGIKKLLNIPGYKITDASLADTVIHIHSEPYKKDRPVCSKCGEVHPKGYHSSQWTKAEDLPISGRRVYLEYIKENIDALWTEKYIQRLYHGSRNDPGQAKGLPNM